MEYNRIIYPERAEYLDEEKFRSYRVFLTHWNPLAAQIKSDYEEALLRRTSKALIVYGDQGTGKTLLAKKLCGDFASTVTALRQSGTTQYDDTNMWHRIASGFGGNPALIATSTPQCSVLHIEDDMQWVRKAKEFTGANDGRTCVIVADNCERDYFVQSLVGLNDSQYLAVGRTDALIKAAAQKFVALCRTELRGAFMLMLTNDAFFALSFEDATNSQHAGLVSTAQIAMPPKQDKEAIVRVNTNRLNPFTYWYCLDRAGMTEKKAVLRTLASSTGFKETFQAVDQAIQRATPTRVGRPPRKCLLTLFLMTDTSDVFGLIDSLLIRDSERNVNLSPLLDVATFTGRWTTPFEVGGERMGKLLESEWNLRIAVAGNQVTSCLRSTSNAPLAKRLIDLVLEHHGPGTHDTTRATHRADIDAVLAKIGGLSVSDLSAFWSAGQVRAHEYESQLRSIYPTYNTGGAGFLQFRPDLIISPYEPCQLSRSASEDDAEINESIRRKAATCEFTAVKTFSLDAVRTYLNRKLPNYIEILQEQ